MKTMFIKSLCLILLSLAGLAASAQTFEVDGINYNVLSEAEGTVEVTSGDYSGDVVIPAEVSHAGTTYRVTTIGDYAFYYCNALTSVSMPSVVTIGEDAFYTCSSLTSVSMPSATTIGDYAFEYCSTLTSVEMPAVATIGEYAFYGCSALTSIYLPASCTSIDGNPFSGCDALKEIVVDEDNPNFSSHDGVLYDKNVETLLACPGSKSSIDTPSSVTTIGYDAFYECSSLTSISMPSVTTIGDYAFNFCSSLTSISMPSVMTIGGYAFYECSSLTSISMPEVTTIGDDAFSGCSALTSVSMPSVTTIGDRAFSSCSALTSVSMPEVKTIGDNVFSFCYALTSLSMPSVTTIGRVAFYYCSALTSVDIPASVSMIGNDAFFLCNALTSVYCHWEDPLECDPRFENTVLETATLYVPTGTVDAYRSVSPWSGFINIVERDYSGIADATAPDVVIKVIDGAISIEGTDSTASAPVVEVYSAGGVCVYRGTDSSIGGLTHGVYVVKVGDTVQKVML